MEIVINEKRRKSKDNGIRLYKEEYDLISAIAKKKKVSRSLVQIVHPRRNRKID